MTDLHVAWDSPASPIKQIEFQTIETPNSEAIIFASDNKEAAQSLKHAQERLYNTFGYDSYIHQIGNDDVLVVRGYDSPVELVDAVNQLGYTKGITSSEERPTPEHDEKLKFSEQFEEWRHSGTLKGAGIAGLAGHLFQAITASSESSFNRWMVTGIYTLNSSIYLHYGNGSSEEIDTDVVLDDLYENLKARGYDIDKSAFEEAKANKSQSFLENLDQLIKEHTIPVNETLGILANVMMIREGMASGEAEGNSFFYGLAGAASLIGSSVAVLVPERKLEDQDPHLGDTLPGKLWSWTQANPMAVLSGMNFINIGFMWADAWGKFQAYRHSNDPSSEGLVGTVQGVAPLATSAFYTVATALSFISSKNGGLRDPEAFDELFSRAAAETLRVPAGEERDTLITHMSGILASHKETGKENTADVIAQELHRRVDILENSPWLDAPYKYQADSISIPVYIDRDAPAREEQDVSNPELKINSQQAMIEPMVATANQHALV